MPAPPASAAAALGERRIPRKSSWRPLSGRRTFAGQGECARHDSNVRPLPPQGTPAVGLGWTRLAEVGSTSRVAALQVPEPARLSTNFCGAWTFLGHSVADTDYGEVWERHRPVENGRGRD